MNVFWLHYPSEAWNGPVLYGLHTYVITKKKKKKKITRCPRQQVSTQLAWSVSPLHNHPFSPVHMFHHDFWRVTVYLTSLSDVSAWGTSVQKLVQMSIWSCQSLPTFIYIEWVGPVQWGWLTRVAKAAWIESLPRMRSTSGQHGGTAMLRLRRWRLSPKGKKKKEKKARSGYGVFTRRDRSHCLIIHTVETVR